MDDLKDRTKRFAIDVIRYCSNLPQKQEFWVITKQLIKSSTSVGANYRSACRAKSKADFIAKLSIVEEEADESMYWMELLEKLGEGKNEVLLRLKDEANQLVSIIVASKKTARNEKK
ncbi:MAG: four helix bundle protein [Bacteroidetes bacterium]|nr:four helix bundle protein [Bacteroidota bacterium]MBU1421677.1 four helix bundle protein [Bacteroidota bacterium]MBU2636836.1 four helix bundle protein [Bacteroidota bacterium]